MSKISNLSYNITELKISLNKINYDQSSKLLSIEILDYSFVGSYKKSTKIGAILDDIFKTLGQLEISRTDIFIIDINSEIISENIKIKNLRIKTDKEEKKEKKEDYEKKKSFKKGRKKEMAPRPADEVGRSSEFFRYRGIFQEPEESYEEREERPGKAREAPKKAPVARSPRLIPPRAPQPAPSATPPPPPGSAPPPGGGPPEEPTTGEFVERVAKKMESDDSLLFKDEISEDLIVYNLNMALQYYSVMMEGKSYLLYVYFSYEELKILDEEGKVVYRTQIKIETRKKEPPILTIKIEGDEFEVHPLYGEVIVKKDAVNPPVIIFSVMPIKRKKDKQKKKDLTRKYLNIYIDFEEKRISHTVLAILVQPKHFRIKIGPIHLDISKKTAYIISLSSFIITIVSFLYTIITYSGTPEIGETLTGFIPGLASALFFITYIVTLIKGFYPIKRKFLSIMNFDKINPINK